MSPLCHIAHLCALRLMLERSEALCRLRSRAPDLTPSRALRRVAAAQAGVWLDQVAGAAVVLGVKSPVLGTRQNALHSIA